MKLKENPVFVKWTTLTLVCEYGHTSVDLSLSLVFDQQIGHGIFCCTTPQHTFNVPLIQLCAVLFLINLRLLDSRGAKLELCFMTHWKGVEKARPQERVI